MVGVDANGSKVDEESVKLDVDDCYGSGLGWPALELRMKRFIQERRRALESLLMAGRPTMKALLDPQGA